MAESPHFVLRWPADKPNLISPPEAQAALAAMERIYAWFTGPTVKWPLPWCDSATKYKFTIFTNDGYGLSGAGNGRDGVEAPAMWVGPGAVRDAATGLPDRIGGMVHEFTHSLQFQSRGMRNTEFGGWFWESQAEFMANQYPGNSGKLGCTSLTAWQPHIYYGSTRVRYCNWQFWDYLKNSYGFEVVNRIMTDTAGQEGQDPLAVLMRNQGWSVSRLGDEFGTYAMRNVTWDYIDRQDGFDRGRRYREGFGPNTDFGTRPDYSVSKRSRLTHLDPVDLTRRQFVVPSYFAPQRYGYNTIKLIPDPQAQSFTVKFRGIVQSSMNPGAELGTQRFEPGAPPNWQNFAMPRNPASNWRWGVVVVDAQGQPRYSALRQGAFADLTVSMLPGDREAYLVVAAAPDEYHGIFWDQLYHTIYRYPYKVELAGALPDGYQAGYDIRVARQYPAGQFHPNGGGWVATAARVDASAYVGPNAAVFGGRVLGNARIEDRAIVWNGTVQDNAVVGGLTQLIDNMTVSDRAVIQSVLSGGQTFHDQDVVTGTAVLFGDLETHLVRTPLTKGAFSGFLYRADMNDPAVGANRTRAPVEVTAPFRGDGPF